LTTLALTVLILGIIVTIGASLMLNLRDNQRADVATLTATNETVTQAQFQTAAGDPLTKAWGVSVKTVINETGHVTLDSANYTTTVDSVSGIMSFKNATENIYGDNWKVTYYYYDTTDPRYSLPNDTAIGIGEFGNWFDIIIIIGIAGLIISLIYLGLGSKSSSSY